jgi:hypothetical protein
MRAQRRRILLLLLLFVSLQMTAEAPEESAHRQGPHGLQGWTLKSSIPDHPGEKFPFALVLARRGNIIQRIEGSPFVWRWMFVADGREVAYETGPLHFSMQCVLIDVATGRMLANYDCFTRLPDNAPDWVKALESSQ